MVTVRPLDHPAEAAALWSLKTAFETGLGASGDADKTAAYRDKLTGEYEQNYLDWVGDCLEANADCIQVADAGEELVGYVFVLPASLAYIWDGAVLNELYVDPDHRGGEVADALFEAALSVVDDQDLPMDRILLDVDPDNERARHFYDRHGFEPWGDLLARDL